MTKSEWKLFEIHIKEIKKISIFNQKYEFSAILRDMEKELTIPSYLGPKEVDWYKVSSLDSLEYYNKISSIVEKYSESTMVNYDLMMKSLNELYKYIFLPFLRENLINEILGEL
jgi:hypothetical protein